MIRFAATLSLTPWSRAALTTEQRADIMTRALALGVHISIDGKGAHGPFRALSDGKPRLPDGSTDTWSRSAYGAADRLLRDQEEGIDPGA